MGDLPSGADEALHQELEAELKRLSSLAPLQVLGLGAGADPAAVRAAFLALTKRLHPSRFARRPQPIVRLANEIFLRVRDAYERASATDARAPRTSDPPVAIDDPRSGGNRSTPTRPPGQPIASPIAAATRPAGPPIANPIAAATRPPGQPIVTPSTSPPGPPVAAAISPPTAPPTRPPGQPSGIDGDLRAAISEKRRRTAAAGVPVVAPRRPTGEPPTGAPTARTSAQPPIAQPAAERGSSGQAPLTDGVPSGTRIDRMRRAEQMMAQGQLAEARIALRSLAADQPDDPRAKALLHFVAGREHLLADRRAEARVELERALAAEPALAEASDLLASLDKKDGGLFSRWFRK